MERERTELRTALDEMETLCRLGADRKQIKAAFERVEGAYDAWQCAMAARPAEPAASGLFEVMGSIVRLQGHLLKREPVLMLGPGGDYAEPVTP